MAISPNQEAAITNMIKLIDKLWDEYLAAVNHDCNFSKVDRAELGKLSVAAQWLREAKDEG